MRNQLLNLLRNNKYVTSLFSLTVSKILSLPLSCNSLIINLFLCGSLNLSDSEFTELFGSVDSFL